MQFWQTMPTHSILSHKCAHGIHRETISAPSLSQCYEFLHSIARRYKDTEAATHHQSDSTRTL